MHIPPRLVTALLVAALGLQTYLLYFFPSTDGPGTLPPGTDKVVHACMFGGVGMLAVIRGWRWALLPLAVYAPVSEVIQAHIGRDGDWHDAVADLTGVLVLGWLVGSRLRRFMA